MSMLAEVRRVPAAELTELIRDPSDIFWYLHGCEPYRAPRSLFTRLFKREPPPRERAPWRAPSDDFRVHLDKAWHCVHFLLSGDPWKGDLPSAYLLAGGTELGDVDVGYGPARALSPAQVSEFHQYLCTVTESDLRERCDPGAMERAEIYGALESVDEVPYVWDHIEALRDLLGSAAAAGDGAIIYIY